MFRPDTPLGETTPIPPLETSAELSTDAMTDGVTPCDDHEKRRLAEAGHTCVDLPAGGVDLHNASADKCSDLTKRNEERTRLHQLPVRLQLAPQPRSRRRHNGCHPIGEGGTRIGGYLDSFLAHIHGSATPEEEASWDEPDFPWEFCEQLLEEIRSEGRPPAELDELISRAKSQPRENRWGILRRQGPWL